MKVDALSAGAEVSVSASKQVKDGNTSANVGADATKGEVSVGATLGAFGAAIKVNVLSAFKAIKSGINMVADYKKEKIKQAVPQSMGGYLNTKDLQNKN